MKMIIQISFFYAAKKRQNYNQLNYITKVSEKNAPIYVHNQTKRGQGTRGWLNKQFEIVFVFCSLEV